MCAERYPWYSWEDQGRAISVVLLGRSRPNDIRGTPGKIKVERYPWYSWEDQGRAICPGFIPGKIKTRTYFRSFSPQQSQSSYANAAHARGKCMHVSTDKLQNECVTTLKLLVLILIPVSIILACP